MSNLSSLMAEREAVILKLRRISADLEAARRMERELALAKIRDLMIAHDISIVDLSISAPPRVSTQKTAPIKYRDRQGNTWTGRGMHPRWLKAALTAGHSLEEFRV